MRKEPHVLAFIRNIGGPEILIILVVVLLLFGAKKLPELARSIGASAKEFKKGVEEGDLEDEPQSEDNAV
ncbi:MAG: twin-arginine translocase TatA/TatE family subunit [Actinomycetia bacterium]|nr:twin-arginine translocase TatA/TatE family subunit [Actinomycetes bacterium]